MMENLKIAMKDSISEVFETMLYLPCEIEEEHEVMSEIQNEKLIISQLKYDGKPSGLINFIVPWNIAISITENFMGKNRDSLEDEYVFGTIKELTNIIAGSALSKYDPKKEYSLGIPEIMDSNKIFEIIENYQDSQILFSIKLPNDLLVFRFTIER